MKNALKIVSAIVNAAEDAVLLYTDFVGQAAPAVGEIAVDFAKAFAESEIPAKMVSAKTLVKTHMKLGRKAIKTMKESFDDAESIIVNSLYAVEMEMNDKDPTNDKAA